MPDALNPVSLEIAEHGALELLTPRLIGVKQWAQKGRGIVALTDIPANTQLERVPVLIIPDRDRVATDKTIIFTYVFMWEHGTTEQDLYRHEGRAAIALGLTSLLNHSYHPNARFVHHIDDLEIELISRRFIRRGEEITIDYEMDLWFDPA
jgi:uncharacterized protein